MSRTYSLILLICCAAGIASAQVKSVALRAETMSTSAYEGGLTVPPEVEERLDWISQAEFTVKGSGAIEELPPSARVAAAGLLRAARSVTEPGPDGCHVVVEEIDGPEGELVPAKKAQTASRAFLGEVVALERGLAHGTPAIVYEVRIGDLVRWPESAVVAQDIEPLPLGGVKQESAGSKRIARASAGREPSAVPRSLEARDPSDDAPLWVSVEAATAPDGTVDWSILGPEVHEGFRNLAESPPVPYSLLERSAGAREMSLVAEEVNPDGTTTTWYHYGWSSLDMPLGEDWASLDDLARDAQAVYLGSVAAITEGFFQGSPASLLTVRVDEVLAARSGHRTDSEVFVYYPSARFSIGDLNFWKSGPSFPDRPSVGDRLLVATDRPPADAGGITVIPKPEGVFIESPARNGVGVKSTMRSVSRESTHLDDVAAKLRALLQDEEPGRCGPASISWTAPPDEPTSGLRNVRDGHEAPRGVPRKLSIPCSPSGAPAHVNRCRSKSRNGRRGSARIEMRVGAGESSGWKIRHSGTDGRRVTGGPGPRRL